MVLKSRLHNVVTKIACESNIILLVSPTYNGEMWSTIEMTNNGLSVGLGRDVAKGTAADHKIDLILYRTAFLHILNYVLSYRFVRYLTDGRRGQKFPQLH